MESAFERRLRSGVISNLGHLDIGAFLDDSRSLFVSHIATALREHNSLKVNTQLTAEYVIQKADEIKTEVKYFSTEYTAIFRSTDLEQWFQIHVREVIPRKMEEFQERDSGWSLRQILSLIININKFNPISGSTFIPLPQQIQSRGACVNVQNNDQKCFVWSILAALHPRKEHANRVPQYREFENELNLSGLDFPLPLKQVSKFEHQNDVSVNVYMLNMKGNNYRVAPCHLTSRKKEKHVNLLLIQDYYIDENDEEEDEEEEDNVTPPPQLHYVCIRSMSRLLGSQMSKSKKTRFICDRCLHYFYSHDKLIKHEEDCRDINNCRIQLPREQDKILSFRNYSKQLAVPYIIYADFECLLKPIENDVRAYQLHQAYSVGYYVKCSFDDRKSAYHSYRQQHEDSDETPAVWFTKRLKALADELQEFHKKPKPLNLTSEEIINFQRADTCHICGKKFVKKSIKVRDHCHISGQYRGAAHSTCNINYREITFIPVIFHNLTGYDSHFIIKEIATEPSFKGRIQLIAENKERYISFTKHITDSDITFRFIDSYRFLASSLEKLASYLAELNITSSVFQQDNGYTTEQIQLLLRKGIFPYDYVSSFDKLTTTTTLPSKDEFYSKLNDSGISDLDYEHATNVWNVFNITTLGEYSDLYMKTDVLLLADVFENFRITCREAYGLDPAHYYTTPGLTWDAMLKYTEVELELLTDIDKLMFVERGIRGGISQCCNRHAKANNPYMTEGYQPDEEEKYLIYFDANNLYGWAMTQSLPQKKFTWMDETTLERFNVLTCPDDSLQGYILEVDLYYPPHIHDNHNDLPFCCEHATPPRSKQPKLLTTLNDKVRYVVHYRALKQALKCGLVLKKVHRVLCFEQRPWLKPYVDLNTDKRKKAKNEFEKLFFKLMINAVYGKTMENERKRTDVKLVQKWKGRYSAEALIAKPNFHSRSIFAENLVAIQLTRTEISITKPVYVGLSVLDISKTLIYDFHYLYMRERVGDRCKLLYTDTDSLIYEIRACNMYKIMREDIQKFDTSDYAEDNIYGLPRTNKKVIGLMKDECSGNVLLEFIGLRSKMYSLRIQNDKPIKKAKGVKASIVKKEITFEDYRDCLFNQVIKTCQQNSIRSKCHIVRTETDTKIALSPHDDKRHLLTNTTDTLSWGHYRLMLDDDNDDFLLAAAVALDVAGDNIEEGSNEEELLLAETEEAALNISREGDDLSSLDATSIAAAAARVGEGVAKRQYKEVNFARIITSLDDSDEPNSKTARLGS